MSDLKCPEAVRLRGWLDDRSSLSEEELDHVSGCAHCQQVLEYLSDAPELRPEHAHPADGRQAYTDEPAFQQLQSQLLAHVGFATPASQGNQNTASQAEKEETARIAPATRTLAEASTDQQAGEAPPLDVESLSSQLPAGRYQVERVLARGGSGIVLLAFDHKLNRNVAIKILSRETARERQRLLREAKAMAEIDHPNVVRILDIGELTEGRAGSGGPTVFTVMEYIDGGTLASHGDMNPEQLAELMGQAADALAAAHRRGLIHRDVKPNNILVSRDGRQVKVADFGLAKFQESASTQVTRTGDLVGTPAYMSPEQLNASIPPSPAIDIYGLGATLYQRLTGQPPFLGTTAAVLRQVLETEPVAPRILDPTVPLDLETICLRALEKEPGSRFASMEEMANDLRRFAEGKPILTRPVGTREKVWRYCRQHRGTTIASATAALAIMLLGIGGVIAALTFHRQNVRLSQAVTEAGAARERTEAALDEAIKAADQLLLSVASDTELLPRTPGSQRVQQQLLERARTYYATFLQEHNDSSELTYQLARAHSGLAQIASRTGEDEVVRQETSAALTLVDKLQASSQAAEARPTKGDTPSVDSLTLLRADVLINLASHLKEQGEAEESLGYFEEALQLLPNSPSGQSPEIEVTASQVVALRGWGEALIAIGRAEEALPKLQRSLELLDELSTVDTAQGRFLRDKALVNMTLATTAIDRGLYAEGKSYLNTAMSLLDQVDPDDAMSLRIRELRGLVLTNLGLAERWLGNLDEAVKAYDGAIAENRRLIELEPSVPGHRWNLVVAVMNSGGPQLQLGNLEPVVQLWQDTLPVLDTLIQEEPENRRYPQVRAMLRSNIAIFLRDLGRYEEAIVPLQAASDTLLEEAERVNRAPEAYLAVALNHYELAVTFEKLERYEEALSAIADADQIVSEILESHPDVIPAKYHQLDLLLLQLQIKVAMDDTEWSELKRIGNAVVEMTETLLAEHPDIARFHLDLPQSLLARGRVFQLQQDWSAAEADYQRASQQLAPLLDEYAGAVELNQAVQLQRLEAWYQRYGQSEMTAALREELKSLRESALQTGVLSEALPEWMQDASWGIH